MIGARRRLPAFLGTATVLAVVGEILTGCVTDQPFPTAAPTPTPPPSVVGTPNPSADPTSPTGVDVRALLPHGPDELRSAVRAAVGFTAAYTTYHYDEPPENYLDRLRPFTTAELANVLARAAHTTGIREQRARDRAVATAEAAPEKIRNLGETSLIVVVRARQTVSGTSGTEQRTQRLAITLVSVDHSTRNQGRWLVHHLQPATTGDPGDVPSTPQTQ